MGGLPEEDEFEQLMEEEGRDPDLLIGISKREPPLDLAKADAGSLEGTWQGLAVGLSLRARFVCPIPEQEYENPQALAKYRLIIANSRTYTMKGYAGLEGFVRGGGALLVTPNAGTLRPEINPRTKRPLGFSTGSGFFNLLHTTRVSSRRAAGWRPVARLRPYGVHTISGGLRDGISLSKPLSLPLLESHHEEVIALEAGEDRKGSALIASEADTGRAAWVPFDLPKLLAEEDAAAAPLRRLAHNLITWLLRRESDDEAAKCLADAIQTAKGAQRRAEQSVSRCGEPVVGKMLAKARGALARAMEMGDARKAITLVRRATAMLCRSRRLAEGSVRDGNVYYVTTGGKDTNNGLSLETPWRTVTHAAAQGEAGDIVRIRLGAYTNENVVVANSGMKGLPIVFEAFRGAPIIVGKDLKGTGIDIAGKQHIRLCGLYATRYRIGICLRDGTEHTVVSDCKAYGCGWCGIYLDADHNVVQDNVVYGNHIRGIGIRGSHNRVRGNDIFDNRYECIQLCKEATHNEISGNKLHDTGWDDNGDSGDGVRIDAHGQVGSNNVHHNRIYRCSRHGFVSYDHSNNNRVAFNVIHDIPRHGVAILGEKATVTHNIVYRCGYGVGTEVGKGNHLIAGNVLYRNGWGISVGSGSGTEVVNNIVVGSTLRGITANREHNPTVQCNCLWENARDNTVPGEGNITADPRFADPAGGDFHLKSRAGRWGGSAFVKDEETSPCVDAGNPLASYANEPGPNGNRANLGAYGNTNEASKSLTRE